MPWMIAPGLTPVFQSITMGGRFECSPYAYTLDTETWLYLSLNPGKAKRNGAPLVVAHIKRKNRKAHA